MKLKRTVLICFKTVLLLSLLLPYSLMAQTLSYEMTEEERALMPAYLEQQGQLYRYAAPPPAPVRNIAEFEPMEGVLVSYPLGVPVSLIAEISKDATVTTLVENSSSEERARRNYQSQGVNLSNCKFLHAPTDSYWTRDYGPWFIADGNGKISIIDFTYNRPRPSDNRVPSAVAGFLNLDSYKMDLVHCGGNYMTESAGVSVSTDLVLSENSMSKPDIDGIVKKYLGVSTYHTTDDPLGEYIKHVDCWGKFLDVDKILITEVPKSHQNYTKFENMAGFFAKQTTSYGNTYEVYRVKSNNGEPYTNSLILNNKVLVPVQSSSSDQAALDAYQAAMPGYQVLKFEGSWQTTDALHCRVKGIADRNMVYIGHLPFYGNKPSSDFEVVATIKAYSNKPLATDGATLNYQVDGGPFQAVQMVSENNSTYKGIIPKPAAGSTVSYYIHAEDSTGNNANHPFIGAFDPHKFSVVSNSITAQFSADATQVAVGGSVTFTDLSSHNPTSFQWTFDGGTPSTSTEQNPVVTYSTPGTYGVTLTVSNQTGSDTEKKVNYITVREGNPNQPVADFSAQKTTIRIGESIRFLDQSQNGPTSWEWSFNSGSPSVSSRQNPRVRYETAGIFSVSLTVSNADGSDTETKNDYITVTDGASELCEPEWVSGERYWTGDMVSYDGKNWKAVRRNKGETPGKGRERPSWRELEPCSFSDEQ